MAEKRRIILPHETTPPEAAAGAAAAAPALPHFWDLALAARSAGCSLPEAANAGFRQIEISAEKGEIADPLRLIGLGASRLKANLRHLELRVAAISWRGPAAARAALDRRAALSALRAAIESAQALGCPLLSLRGEIASPAEKKEGWRYLLDTIYDLETYLRRAGVAAAVEAGGEEADALTAPAVIRNFLAAAPAAIRLTWGQEFFTARRSDIGDLVNRAAHVRIPAKEDDKGRLILANPTAAGDMVAAVSSAEGGAVAIFPQCSSRPSQEDLRLLQETAGRLLLAQGKGK